MQRLKFRFAKTAVLCFCLACIPRLGVAADVTFYSFGDSHYGAAGGGMTNWVYRINRMAGTPYPAALGGGTVAPARGILTLGDLINDGGNLALGTNQWKEWKADYGVNAEGTCIYPVFENFGNHDLHNTRFVQKDIIRRNVTRPGLTAVSTNGLHYSWDWDGVHFVALGIYAATTWVPENTYGSVHDPEYALSFLKWDLENNVGDSGRPVITMHHYDFLTDWWPSWQKLEYPRVLDGYNVVLILHGHQGSPYGYDWQGYTVSGQNGTLNVCHITTNNQIQLAQSTGTNTWGNTYSKSFSFPDLGLSWNGVPKNGDRNVQASETRLAWRTGAYVQSQDVYFGTSSNAVVNSTTPDFSGLVASVTNVAIPTAFLPLQPGTEYFWRVDQQNGSKPFSKGRVWSFRTKDLVKSNDLTFLFVSDVHYQDNTLLANQKNVQAMNGIPGAAYPGSFGGRVKTPRGVVFGGDATSDAKLWQYRFYTNDYGLTGEKVLKYPVAGENNGNHDGGLGSVVGDSLVARNRTRTGLTGISTNGLHISWDWDGIHFVTLGVRPGTNTSPYNSHGSLEFLLDDLKRTVGNSGQPVVLTEHFGLDSYAAGWWTAEERTRYYNVIKDYNVIGIFHGHTHVTEIYKWNNVDIFHPPHMQFGGSYSVTVSSSQGFFVTHIVSNTMSVVERKADGTWGMNLTKKIYRSYAEAGLAGVVNEASGAANIEAVSATLNGKLVYQAAAPTHGYIYYGPSDGGTNKGSWSKLALVGPVGLGGFKTNVSELTAGTTYYYRCYASNSVGTAWSAGGSSFTTLPPAEVGNASGASNIRMATATLNGRLTQTGAIPTQVHIYYGPSDGGTSKAAWANELALGKCPLGAFSQAVSGLSAETTYYYRCYASNALGGRFASTSASFVTHAPVAVNNGLGASGIGVVSATLNGNVLITNAAPTYVSIYWGTNDGGTVRANWTKEVALGTREPGTFSQAIGGLKPETRYYYRSYATNSAGGRWAASTSSFDSARDFSAWKNRMKITFKGYNRSEALINFPVLVVLHEGITNFCYSQFASPQGGDLRFATANNSEVKFEIDEWNLGGTSYAWVQVPVLADTNTYIWAYWGNPSETNCPAYTTNGAAWSEGFAGVWHLGEPNSQDSLNLNHGTSQGATNAPGLIGICQGMPGGADRSVVVNTVKANLDITGNLSVGGWIYYNGTTMAGILTKGATWGDYNLLTKGGTGNALSYELKPFCADGSTAPIGTTSLRVGRWYHVYGTWDGAQAKVYVNGKEEASKTRSGIINSTSHILKLGTVNDRYLNGYLDEVSISSVSRSANWVWASYMSQGSNSVFTSYVVVTSAPPTAAVSHLRGASATAVNSATLSGNLSSLAASPTYVDCGWGIVNDVATKVSWRNAVASGAREGCGISADITDLKGGTACYHRCFAAAALVAAWSDRGQADEGGHDEESKPDWTGNAHGMTRAAEQPPRTFCSLRPSRAEVHLGLTT